MLGEEKQGLKTLKIKQLTHFILYTGADRN